MAVPVGGVIEVTVQGTLFNQITMNVFHLTPIALASEPDTEAEIARLVDTHFTGDPVTISDALAQCMPSNWLPRPTTGQQVYPERRIRVSVPNAMIGAGGEATTANVQASLTLQTIRAARDGRGAKRVVIAPSDSVNGQLTPALSVKMATFANFFLNPLNVPAIGGQYLIVVYHRRADPGFKWDRVVRTITQTTTRVMRRRTVGVGI